jgi:hypothetical protein
VQYPLLVPGVPTPGRTASVRQACRSTCSRGDGFRRRYCAEQIEGRFILIGGDIFDLDRFEYAAEPTRAITGSMGTMIGLEVHAHMLARNCWTRRALCHAAGVAAVAALASSSSSRRVRSPAWH